MVQGESSEKNIDHKSGNLTGQDRAHEAGGVGIHELEQSRSELEGDRPNRWSNKNAVEIGVKSAVGTRRDTER